MNRNILTFLNEYAEIPDPQYAIMLRGAWGCGKTFFIRQWMEQLKSNRDADKLKWQPIYVSLYGLTTTQQITEQINKEISPWLYSKGMKLAKNILKAASKIALKYDIDGDGKDEGSVTCDLDSILLLKEENSEIKGNKILIFDDLERCDIKLETLLGYINYFSEHCKCKVIIIGDENKISEKEGEKSNLKFKDFKEKTIGRTFEIKVNIEETLDFFIGEISANNRNLLSENKELIIKIFHASKFDNLRVLRQCLNDYHRIIMALPEHYHESPKYKLIITSLLANFVAVYCEYKGGNTEIASLFNSLYNMFPDKEKNEEREKILSKYHFIEIGKRLDIFSDFIVNEKEKNINLNVALKLGKQIKKNCPDVKVIYTRDRDIFIPLDRRAEIANNAKADLFISIHTNALAKNRTAKGASTWTLGLAKSDANLEVAKRENAVILYESDYKTRYAGFNPNSAESYIIFEFMQDKYMSQSVHLASLVQKHFRQTCKRTDRGVHQAGFLVLKASAMPSILVELGFISTPEEERYLNTEAGTTSLANGIFRAFLTYKREQEIRLNGSSNTILPEDVPEPVQEEGNAATATPEKKNAPQAESNQAAQRPQRSENAAVSQTEQSGIVFKIQILTSSRPLAKNDKRLKGLKDVDYYKEGGIYKYTYGASPDYNKVLRSKRSITDKFKDAFIIAFKNGEKINVNTAISEFKKNRNK